MTTNTPSVAIPRTLRILTILIAGCLIALANRPLPAATIIPTGQPKVLDRCGRGALLEIEGQRVLLIAGSPWEMGYQQGKLLSGPIQAMMKTVLTVARAADSNRYDDYFNGSIEQAWQRTRPFIPQRYLDEMAGLAAGSGIPLNEIQWGNIFPELFHCSGFALSASATSDGTLYHGRILDYMTEVGLQQHALITVAQPDGQTPFITIGYAGFIGSVTGMNARQVAIGEMGGRGEGNWDGMPMSFLVRKALEEADSLNQAVEIFRSTPRTCEYYYVISDGKLPDARGLACAPDRFEVVAPGQSHPQLPHPVKDAVLLSAGDRYEHLAARVQAQYGKIDLDHALDLMNRPIAMTSCLHRVLFAPQTLRLWVANAIAPENDNFAACYQPYYAYELPTLLKMIPAQTPEGVTAVPPRPRQETGNASQPTRLEDAQTITGSVSPAGFRALPPAANPQQDRLLSVYRVQPAPFEYQIKPTHDLGAYQVHQLSFPSSWHSAVPQHNTVYCEYYDCQGAESRPAVILLDILDGSMTASRIIANTLAHSGVNACIMVLPCYGQRSATNTVELKRMTDDPNTLVSAVRQAVMDVQRTAQVLAALPHVDADRIGLCGTSLGGCIAALAAGVDGRFPRVFTLLAGGDLVSILNSDSNEVKQFKLLLQQNNISLSDLRRLLATIEPVNFADRLTHTRLLMVNGSQDPIIPAQCARRLADTAAAEIRWFKTDHYGMVRYLIPVQQMIVTHFQNAPWTESK